MTIKVIVTGCAGRMGRRIIHMIDAAEGVSLAGGTEVAGSPLIGQDAGLVAGVGEKNAPIVGSLAEIVERGDVIIDFSIPVASYEHFLISHEAKTPIVIGTTGFNDEQWTTFESMRGSHKAVIAPNMSVGVNVLFKLARDAAKILGDDYDVEIVEMHHNQKIDAPSGTGARLAEIVADALGRDLKEVGNYGRHGNVGVRPKKEIGVMTLRGGDVVGDHTVMFAGQGERVELTHKAGSRDNFAKGAVRAAAWIVGQPNGIYDMQDVLELR
jgi:4-hydroxy-tetrahydrodipicolinate reductase